ncbi:MAG: glycosyltransferase family 2 protein [Candidatus Eisenbacteria bacterium]|uniref:Glycosyltransferase family 2 protein n=1 Tax=Eiseniibacteriota bacterium TaxID=2212470 RepID=A0A938BP21_UNCEI|nr:glycosyltransferase family 2 protein [Candidatus Eisenbacteria bacterium]
MPAYNEAARLGIVIGDLFRAAPGTPLLVVDDGSRDGTAEAARAAGAAVVAHPFNLGYGAALQTGYRYALRAGFARVIQMDADGQHDPGSLERIVAALDEGADLVLGSRFLDLTSYRPPLARRAGMGLFRTLAAILLRRRLSDVTTGYQGLSRRLVDFYDRRGIFPPDYPDANIIVRAVRAGFRLSEVPARMADNPAGGSIHVGLKPVAYVFKMVFALLVEAGRRLPAPEARG